MRHQPVEPRHAAVIDALHAVAHGLAGDGGLLGHGLVGGAGTHDDDEPEALLVTGPDHGDARLRVEPVGQPALRHGLEHALVGARGEDVVVLLGEPAEDGHHLLGRLPLAEHRLRDPVAQRAVEIHAGEAQVLHGQVAQARQRALGRQRPARHLL